MKNVVGSITSSDPDEKQRSSGVCLACDRVVPGTETDRLRAGFCSACTMAKKRSGITDRAAFVRHRKAQLAPREEAS